MSSALFFIAISCNAIRKTSLFKGGSDVDGVLVFTIPLHDVEDDGASHRVDDNQDEHCQRAADGRRLPGQVRACEALLQAAEGRLAAAPGYPFALTADDSDVSRVFLRGHPLEPTSAKPQILHVPI